MTLNLTFKNRFQISAAIFIVLLAAVSVLIVWPSLQEIRLINRQVYEERVRLEKLYVRGQLQKKVRANYAKIEGETRFLDDILLKENQELQYITALESAANANNVELKINIGESKRLPNQLFSALGISFELTGSYPDILAWIAALETMPYYTNINETAIAVHPPKDGGQAAATANINAETYWLLP